MVSLEELVHPLITYPSFVPIQRLPLESSICMVAVTSTPFLLEITWPLLPLGNICPKLISQSPSILYQKRSIFSPAIPLLEFPHRMKLFSSIASSLIAEVPEKGSNGNSSSPDRIQKYSGDDPISSIS